MSSSSSSLPNQVRATGRVTRVAAKFLYVRSTKYGGVFVPPCAALPPDCSNPDLTHHFQPGDIVHFVATLQKGKNDCNYLASKIELSKRSLNGQLVENDENNAEAADGDDAAAEGDAVQMAEAEARDLHVVSDLVGAISHVTETYGFIFAEEQGLVFFPGSAYQPLRGEPNRLNAVFKGGDAVMFSARPQPEMNGCKWLALSVRKQSHPPTSRDSSPARSSSPPVNLARQLPWGQGMVVSIQPGYGFLWSEREQETVFFTISSWHGEHSESLVDVLRVGSELSFLAVPQEPKNGCRWRAVKVYLKGCVPALNVAPCRVERGAQTEPYMIPLIVGGAARVGELKGTQTHIFHEQLLVQTLKTHQDLYELCYERFPAVMRYVDTCEASIPVSKTRLSFNQ